MNGSVPAPPLSLSASLAQSDAGRVTCSLRMDKGHKLPAVWAREVTRFGTTERRRGGWRPPPPPRQEGGRTLCVRREKAEGGGARGRTGAQGTHPLGFARPGTRASLPPQSSRSSPTTTGSSRRPVASWTTAAAACLRPPPSPSRPRAPTRAPRARRSTGGCPWPAQV